MGLRSESGSKERINQSVFEVTVPDQLVEVRLNASTSIRRSQEQEERPSTAIYGLRSYAAGRSERVLPGLGTRDAGKILKALRALRADVYE